MYNLQILMERLLNEVVTTYQNKLSDSSREAIRRAVEIAREWHHLYVNIDHLVLPLLESPAVKQFFRKLGLDPQLAKRNIEDSFIPGDALATDEIKTTNSFNRALEITDQTAISANPINPENLFLGVVIEGGLSTFGIREEFVVKYRDFLFDLQVKSLREQKLGNHQIANQLRVSVWKVNQTCHKLITTGEILPIAKPEGVKADLEQLLARHTAQNPDKPIVLAELAREVGVSRERIRQLYQQIAAVVEVPPIIQKSLKEEQIAFDQKVQQLLNEGLNVPEIAEKLYVFPKIVIRSKLRLYRQEMNKRRELVKQLRIQGTGEKAIMETTGLSRGQLNHIFGILIEEGLRIRKKYRTTEETEQFKDRVEQLRMDPRNLTQKQIAEITGEKVETVTSYINKLIAEGRIPRKIVRHKKTKSTPTPTSEVC